MDLSIGRHSSVSHLRSAASSLLIADVGVREEIKMQDMRFLESSYQLRSVTFSTDRQPCDEKGNDRVRHREIGHLT